MIAASLLLILVAVVLLGAGLARGDNLVLVASIAASLLAAVALVVGARKTGNGPAGEQPDEFGGEPVSEPAVDSDLNQPPGGPAWSAGEATAATAGPGIPMRTGIPVQTSAAAQPDDDDDEDPADEPPARSVAAADVVRLARLSIEVLVVDGRPRYHLAGCQHLLGRETEPLPVSEAVELGFTPCSLCEPDSALLAEAPRG